MTLTFEPTLRSTAHLQFARAHPQAQNCKRAALPHPKKTLPQKTFSNLVLCRKHSKKTILILSSFVDTDEEFFLLQLLTLYKKNAGRRSNIKHFSTFQSSVSGDRFVLLSPHFFYTWPLGTC